MKKSYIKLMGRGFGNEATVICGEKSKVEQAAENWLSTRTLDSAKYTQITRAQARREQANYQNPVFTVEDWLASPDGIVNPNFEVKL